MEFPPSKIKFSAPTRGSPVIEDEQRKRYVVKVGVEGEVGNGKLRGS